MPYTMEDLERDVAERVLKKLTIEQRLEGLSPTQRVEGLSTEQILSRVPLEKIEQYLEKHKAAQDKNSPSQPDDTSK